MPTLPPGGAAGDSRHPALILLIDVLDTLDTLTSSDRPPPHARHLLCRLAARAVGAAAAGHARHDADRRLTRLTTWSADAGSDGPARVRAWVEYDEQPTGRAASRTAWFADGWPAGPARRRILAVLDQPHLVELPLAAEPSPPSLVVVGRATPFAEAEVDSMAGVARTLRTLDAVLDRLDAAATPPAERDPPETRPDHHGHDQDDRDGHAHGTGTPDRPVLTRREVEVLQMLAEGMLARSIAQRLEVSERTVHKHLGNAYRKLDAHDRLLAVRRAETFGLLTPTPAPVPQGAAR